MKNKETTVCANINLALLLVIWALLPTLVNLLWRIPIWANIILVPASLVVAGYIVQYVVSPIVNSAVMRWLR